MLTDALVTFAPISATTLAQVPGSTPAGTTTPAGPTGTTPTGTPAGSGLGFFVPMMLILVAMIVFTSLAGRKQRKLRQQMLASIKRGDRIVTTGGVIGTITDLNDSEMTLRVDEASNTKIRFRRAAIEALVKEGKDTGSTFESKPEGKPEGKSEQLTTAR
jgi:preprotein translocase subunit YajC